MRDVAAAVTLLALLLLLLHLARLTLLLLALLLLLLLAWLAADCSGQRCQLLFRCTCGQQQAVRSAWEQGQKCGNVWPDLGLNLQMAASLNELLDCVNIIVVGHMLCTKRFKPKGAQLSVCIKGQAQAWKAGVGTGMGAGCSANQRTSCKAPGLQHTIASPLPP